MHRIRIGIRGKLLASFGVLLLLVVALETFAYDAAVGAGREFAERLTRYHAVQELRSSLATSRALGERYMRERLPEQRDQLALGLSDLPALAERLQPLAAESQEAFFQARAARRGIAAWVPLARDAVARRTAGEDAYAGWARADRIASYVDGYLGSLLTASMDTGWSRYRELVDRSQSRRRLALATLFGAAAVALGFAALFASSITAPIRKLADAADRMASGDLRVDPVVAATGDEVEVLTRSFTVMSASMHQLVEGLREKARLERLLHDETLSRVSMEMALREAQFMNLQDQVRPHFLFNALNTISRSALFEGAAATEALARTLGKLMRYSLAEGGPFTTLGEELAVLRDYLSFQAIRFGPRLTWEVRAEPAIEAAVLPRFTLQPLVENAVRHGIEPKEQGGRVIVSARRVRARIRLVVADSGVGMGPELLVRLRSAASRRARSPAPRGAGPGIGIANLVLRLENRYAGQARIAIASRPGRGTIMRISLPEQQGGAAHGL